LNCGGKTWEKGITLYMYGASGSLQLKADATLGVTRTLTFTDGELTVVDGANNWDISTGYISLGVNGVLTMGSATLFITTATGTINLLGTVTANTGTIKITGSLTGGIYFNGAGKTTLNNFWNATTGAQIVTIAGSNTWADFKIDAGRSMKFTDGTDQTVTSLTAIGTSGAGVITLRGTSTAGWKISDTTGTNTVEYCDIDYSTAEGGATWVASTDDGNVDGGHNTGWDFSGAGGSDTTGFFAFF
jgi:hypothetical protein